MAVALVVAGVGCVVCEKWEDTGISESFQRAAERGLGPTLDEGHQSPAPVPVGSRKAHKNTETSSQCAAAGAASGSRSSTTGTSRALASLGLNGASPQKTSCDLPPVNNLGGQRHRRHLNIKHR